MKTSGTRETPKKYSAFFDSTYLTLAFISLSALIVTFLISNSTFRFETKTAVFLTIVFGYLSICVFFYLGQKKRASVSSFDTDVSESVFNAEIENKLLALEEASEFFSASLKPADMFRLVASRVNEIVPFAASALFRLEESNLKVISAVGENARMFLNLNLDLSKGLAAKSLQTGKIETDEKLVLEKEAIPTGTLNNLESAIDIPLNSGEGKGLGVFVLYGDRERKFDFNS